MNNNPAAPKTKKEFVETVTRLLDEGWSIYAPIVFTELEEQGKPYIRSFPLLKIKETSNGYECLLQGWGTGEVQGGTVFQYISPK